MRLLNLASILFVSFLLVGCAAKDPSKAVQFDMTKQNYQASEKLLKEAGLPAGTAIIMATVVNIDDIENSSTLGRSISEQVSSRLVQAGMNVIEMKFRESLYMKQNAGELMLSRDIEKIAKTHSSNVVVIGTYAMSKSAVYVNLKMIDPSTNVALSSNDYVLPMNEDVAEMAGKKSATIFSNK